MQSSQRDADLQPSAADERSQTIATSDARELNPVLAALRRVPLFGELCDADLDALARVATLAHHPKRSYLFHGGDPGGALLVVVSGLIEVRIERAGAHPLQLTAFQSGEFFGEMSFFDGQPRSAAAIAIVDSTILSIARADLPKGLMGLIAAGVLTEVAKRVRQTDQTLTQLSDDVSRAAHVNGHTAVAVELDAIKTLYRRTEAVAAETLERADKRAQDVMSRADARAAEVMSDADQRIQEVMSRAEARAAEVMTRAGALSDEVKGHVERVWTLLRKRVAPVAAVLSLMLGYFGVASLKDVTAKYREITAVHTKAISDGHEVETQVQHAESVADQLTTTYRHVRALEETMGELRAVRASVALDGDIDSPDKLQRAALNYERAKTELRERYFGHDDDGQRFEHFPSEVVFEAVDTFITIEMAGDYDGVLRLSQSDRSELLAALGYVLINLGDVSPQGEPGHAALLLDKRVRDMLALVADGAEHAALGKLQSDWVAALERSQTLRARDNIALSLAQLGSHAGPVKEQLAAMVASEQTQRAAPAALALARLGDARGFTYLRSSLQRGDESAYASALQLAEARVSELSALLQHNPHAGMNTSQLIAAIEHALRAHVPSNCIEERYARYLGSCLHGACDAAAVKDATCPTFTASRR